MAVLGPILAVFSSGMGATTVNLAMATIRVVLAPNAFKGTLTSSEAARAMAAGVRTAMPDAECILRPMADGGDGTVSAFVEAGYRSVAIEVRDALGRVHVTEIAMKDDHAVVELASTCGIAALDGALDPMGASTLGLGDAIRAALDHGASTISIGLGGSASTDGGSGMLVSLGARLLDADRSEVEPTGAGLPRVEHLDLAGMDDRLQRCRIDVLADVSSPLHGAAGAAHVFGPQKGASPKQVSHLDDGLRRWGYVLAETTGRVIDEVPGAGAAGGTGAAALAVLEASIRPGSAAIADLIGLEDAISHADLVVTGEGRLDESTLAGKGCGQVISIARSAGVPVAVVCGQITLDALAVRDLGVIAWAQAIDHPGSPERALQSAIATLDWLKV